MKDCTECIHNECCVYLWKFKFDNTDSVRVLRKNPYTKKSCGHYMEKDKTERTLQHLDKHPKRIEAIVKVSFEWIKKQYKKLIGISLLLLFVSGCAHYKECRAMHKYLFKDASCESGYSVPYMSGHPTCLSMENLEKLREYCPSFK
uniref:Uncharacterized protein n=1 Tax=viral metagenome TaxID=1070528 RepID=A0A6H1ZA15_9ZZZZ